MVRPMEVLQVRLLFAFAVAPSYIYQVFATGKTHYIAGAGILACLLVLSQYLLPNRNGSSWTVFLTPVLGCLLNAYVIFTTGFERSPLLFVVLIPLITYTVERDGVWVSRALMLNSLILVVLITKSVLEGHWLSALHCVAIAVLTCVAGYYAMRVQHEVSDIIADVARDPLTGLHNRRSFEEHASKLTGAGTSFVLILCDLDHFKAYQDLHGHLEGDRVLKRVSEILATVVGLDGTAFRWGGDEFVLLLPNNRSEAVKSVCERINRWIKNELPGLGVSFGVAYFKDDGSSLTDLLDVADRQLYKAKRIGQSDVHS